MKTRLLNLTLYEIGWFACVLGAARGWSSAGATLALALTAIHILLSIERRSELLLVLSVGLIGTTLETLLLPFDVLVFESHAPEARLPPLWIAALWLQFATLLNFALDWLAGRPLLAFLAGAVGGPLAFVAGEALGAAAIGEPRLRSLAALALVWGCVLPLLFALAARLSGPRAGRYRGLEAQPPGY
jgi:hypothetical protein